MIKENIDNMTTSKFFHGKFKLQTRENTCKIYTFTKVGSTIDKEYADKKGETTLWNMGVKHEQEVHRRKGDKFTRVKLLNLTGTGGNVYWNH